MKSNQWFFSAARLAATALEMLCGCLILRCFAGRMWATGSEPLFLGRTAFDGRPMGALPLPLILYNRLDLWVLLIPITPAFLRRPLVDAVCPL